MALPVVERIAQKIEGRLALIDTPAYSFRAVIERRTRIGGFTPADRHIAIIQGQRTKDTAHAVEDSQLGYLLAWWQHWGIAVYAIDSDKSTTPVDQTINIRQAEAEKALCVPEVVGADWVKFDGLALSAEFGDPLAFVDGQFSGALLDLAVLYRHPENDPYTVA